MAVEPIEVFLESEWGQHAPLLALQEELIRESGRAAALRGDDILTSMPREAYDTDVIVWLIGYMAGQREMVCGGRLSPRKSRKDEEFEFREAVAMGLYAS